MYANSANWILINTAYIYKKNSPFDCLHSDFLESQGLLDVRLSAVNNVKIINFYFSVEQEAFCLKVI